jgi:hypothetical protein
MGYPIPDVHSSKVMRDSLRTGMWDRLKAHLGDFHDRRWTVFYHAQSITFRHQKRGHQLKVTTDGQIFLDRRISGIEYKSEHFKFDDTEKAAIRTREILDSMI